MTPDAAERRALQRLREDTARRMDAMPTTHDDDVRTLIAAHDALVDALRATVVRAVAAEGAIALLSRTLGCESGDPAGIVREALDYAAEQRERADERDDALAQRDAADARHAALAGAVRAEREARDAVPEGFDADHAGADERARVCALWDAADAATKHLDALLAGAPAPAVVPADVVRAYRDAVDANDTARDEVDRIGDAIERGRSMDTPTHAAAMRRAGVAGEALFLARTALDAALAATEAPHA